MPAIPLRGDRAAQDAASYRTLHANDIDTSASSIHHTLGTGQYQAASGSHTHSSSGFNSGSSAAGEILTSLGSGSLTWLSLANHSHSGSTSGDGGKLDWDNIWSDAVHSHSGSAEGGILNISSMSSGSAAAGYTLIADGSGSASWGIIPTGTTITTLDTIQNVHVPVPNDGDVLTWNAATGSWVSSPAVDWSVTLTQDDATNDSDKTFTAPASVEWQILWVWVEYTSTATAGTRQLEIQLQDASSNVIGQFQTGVTQAENLTYKYLFAIGVSDLTTVRDSNNVTTPLPAGTFLSAGQKIRVWDNKAIDASADDMVVRMQYATRSTVITEVYYSISVNSATQLQTADSVGAFTRHQLLSMGDISHIHTSQNTTLVTRDNTLVVQNSTQLQTSDIITLPQQTYALVISNSTQLQTTDSMALTQYHILAVNNSTQKITTESVILLLITHYYVVTQNTAQAQTAENTSLTFYAGVIVQDAVQLQEAENTIISTDTFILSLHDAAQAQTANSFSMVTNKATLGMNNSSHVQISEIPTLSMNNSVQAQVTEGGLILTHYQKALVVNNSSMKLATEKVNLVL